MTARRTPRALTRALGVVSLTAPLALVLVAGTAPAAFASGSFSAPAADQVFSDANKNPAGDTVAVSASVTVSPGKSVKLAVDGPSYSGNQTYSNSTLFSATKTITVNVGVKASAPNGKFTAVLTGDATGTRYFYTNFRPTGTPANVAAQATNPAPGATTGTVALSWTYAGAEPDQWGFHVDDGAGWSADLTTAEAGCDASGACHYTKQYDNAPGSTQSYSFTVAALRASGGCGTCGSTVAGTASSPATAQLVTPATPPSPTPAPSGSASPAPGTTGGSTGGGSTSTTGGTQASGGKTGSSGSKVPAILVPTLNPVAAQRKAFALSFNRFSPSLGIPKLPPLPATTFPETVGGSQDAYQPVLPYKAQPAHTTISVLSSPLAVVRNLDTTQLAKSIAAALILLVTAAHVRLFLRSQRLD